MIPSRFMLTILLLTGLLPKAVAETRNLDLLLLYDNATEQAFGGEPDAGLRGWVEEINTMYQASRVNLKLNVVGIVKNQGRGSDMHEVLRSITYDPWVMRQRDHFGADIVAQIHRHGACGVAWVSLSERYAYSVTGPQCGAITLAHEIGHNLGLRHSHRQGEEGLRYPYGVGHGVDGLFSTIMAYSSDYGAAKIARFSNPWRQCWDEPCGVRPGSPDEAHATLAINQVSGEASVWRQPKPGSANPEQVLPDGTYLVRASHSDRCATVGKADPDSRLGVIQWSCHKGKNQQWHVQHLGNGEYELRSSKYQRCLGAGDGVHTLSSADMLNCTRADNVRWRIEPREGGTYSLQAGYTERYLKVRRDQTGNGARLRQWYWEGTASQLFHFERL